MELVAASQPTSSVRVHHRFQANGTRYQIQFALFVHVLLLYLLKSAQRNMARRIRSAQGQVSWTRFLGLELHFRLGNIRPHLQVLGNVLKDWCQFGESGGYLLDWQNESGSFCHLGSLGLRRLFFCL